MKHEFVRITGTKYRRPDGLCIYLPDDKRLWRIATHDGFDLKNEKGSARRFSCFENAEKFAQGVK